MYTPPYSFTPAFVATLATCALLQGFVTPAHAGIPECRGMRLEDVASGGCEMRLDLECSAGCDQLGVYEKACATRLHTVCREECTLSAEQGCTDECTVECTDRCDAGENITCTHNCFSECRGTCDERCGGAEDEDRCRASCEATCDGQCDVQCAPLINAGCYEHCIECCDGSCSAKANMDCQTTCQEEEFRDCEHEFRAECDVGCDGDGALFCGGEYVLSGRDLRSCGEALITRGTLDVEAAAKAQGTVDFGDLGNPQLGSDAGCAIGRERNATASAAGWLALGLLLGCRRRAVSRRSRI